MIEKYKKISEMKGTGSLSDFSIIPFVNPGDTNNYITTYKEIADKTLDGIPTNDDIQSLVSTIQADIDTKQNILIDGSNIKTIMNNSLLGSGNINLEELEYTRQKGTDTYALLLTTYPTPEKGWTVLVRYDETNENKATLRQWNGAMWVNLETVIYNDDVALNTESNRFVFSNDKTLNRFFKELYLNKTTWMNNCAVGYIKRNVAGVWGFNLMVKANGTVICEFTTTTNPETTQILTMSQRSGSTATGYAVVDWNSIPSGTEITNGGNSNTYPVSPIAVDLRFSPFINASFSLDAAKTELNTNIINNKFIYVKDTVVDSAKVGGQLFNGAYRENGVLIIPAGSTGQNSYSSLPVASITGVSGIMQAKVYNTIGNLIWKYNTVVITPTSIQDLGGNIQLLTFNITNDGNLDGVVTSQYVGTTTTETDRRLEYLAFNYKSANDKGDRSVSQILIDNQIKDLYNKIQPANNVVTVAATGTVGVDADFVGVNCIQDAINSITGATESNQYTVFIKNGFYYVTNGSQYKGNPTFPAMVFMKSYIHLLGEDINQTVIKAELPLNDADIDGTIKDRNMYQTVWNNANAKIENLTLIAKNIRYTVHMDDPSGANKEKNFKNLRCIFEGEKGYANVFGLGCWTGETVNIENCEITGVKSVFGTHNNTQFQKPARYVLKNNTITTKANERINIQSCGSLLKDSIYFEGNKLPTVMGYLDLWLRNNKAQNQDSFDHAEFRIIGNGNSKVLFDNTVNGKSLMIKSLSTGNSSSVKFDETSSAFSLIINSKYQTGTPIRSKGNYYIENGCYVMEGSTGVSAYSFGTLDVQEGAASYDTGINYVSLGKRLGDCSAVNKQLKVNIDGTTYTITFDKNYTGMTNAAILAEINTVIGSVATASEYIYGREYYHEFTDCVKTLKNETGIKINKGSVVEIQGNNIILASENSINIGVALEDIPSTKENSVSDFYGMGRILIRGYIYDRSLNKSHFVNCPAVTKGDRLSISSGTLVSNIEGKIEAINDNVVEI